MVGGYRLTGFNLMCFKSSFEAKGANFITENVKLNTSVGKYITAYVLCFLSAKCHLVNDECSHRSPTSPASFSIGHEVMNE